MITRRDAIKLGAVGLVSSPRVSVAIVNGTSVTRLVENPSDQVDTHRLKAHQYPSLIGPSLDKPIVVRWRHSARHLVYNPLVANDIIITGGLGQDIYAVSTTTGEEIWRFTAADSLGLPSLHSGAIFVASGNGTLHSLDARVGSELWRVTLNSQLYLAGVYRGYVICVGDFRTIHGIDPTTGKEMWNRSVKDPIRSPVVDDGIMYIASKDILLAFNIHSGEERWQLSFGEEVNSLPRIIDGRLYISTRDTLYCLEASTGEELWHFTTGAHLGRFDSAGSVVYVTSENRLYAIETTIGRERWHYSSTDTITISGSTEGVVYISNQHELISIDRENGTELWSYDAKTRLQVLSIVDGVLYTIADSTYGIVALNASTGAEFWSFTGTMGTDAIVGGWIFIAAGSTTLALGNPPPMLLNQDVILRGAPSSSAIERSTITARTEINEIISTEFRDDKSWTSVRIGEVEGWIPTEAIDQSTLPPLEGWEVVYSP